MVNFFTETYKGKKVLVTGHTGFKGGWLSLWLKETGAQVIGYSLEPPTEPSLFEAIDLKSKTTHITGDVRDEEHLMSVFNKYKPNFVFHLAAQPLVRYSYEEPKLTYETNVIGTVNILEAIRNSPSVKVCVIITSDKCYENKEWVFGYRETDPMGGHDPYSSSKGCAELVIKAYRNSFFNQGERGIGHKPAIASARAGNVIGGGDWGEDRLIPDCMRALSRRETIILRNPTAVRPWQFVLEPLSGYLLLGKLMSENVLSFSEAWNFGPNDATTFTVKNLVRAIIERWGRGEFSIDSSAHPHEANLLRLDTSKAIMLLGWKPIYDVEEAISRTVSWYLKFYNGASHEELYKLSLNEIQEYQNRINKHYKTGR